MTPSLKVYVTKFGRVQHTIPELVSMLGQAEPPPSVSIHATQLTGWRVRVSTKEIYFEFIGGFTRAEIMQAMYRFMNINDELVLESAS